MHIKYSWRISSAFVPKFVQQPKRTAGQAIVELTLALTFLTFLFAAAVDLGLAFKAYQTLINGSAEASGYLKIRATEGCAPGATNCDADVAAAIERADREARVRFRGEQGNKLGGFASTLDLDADGKDDLASTGNNYGEPWIKQWVQIHAADEEQLNATQSNFAVGSTFTPGTTNKACREERKPTYTVPLPDGTKEVRQCFLVVRSTIIYKPFAIAPAVGDQMTIKAISVVPITASN